MPAVSCSAVGELADGRTVHLWRVVSPVGITIEVLTLGASLHALYTPDRHGHWANVVLSPKALDDRLGAARYFGATVGRYANRIARGELPLPDGVRQLDRNEGRHTLHGGPAGFDTRLWSARPLAGQGRRGVELRLASRDGDQGFPGALDVSVAYCLDDAGTLTVHCAARTDAPTHVNLANHSYFQLAPATGATVLDHELTLSADHYTAVDADLLPLPGPHRAVAGTPFDFTLPHPVGERIGADDEQLRAGGGYDHNWVLRGSGPRPEPAAVLSHAGSGRRMAIHTDQPGIQVYSGNHFDGSVIDTLGRPLGRHAGIALETQAFPDTPNRPEHPSTVLAPGETYRATTVYRFSTAA